MQETQEQFRYLPAEAMREIGRFLRIPESTIYGVSTFYAQFKLTPLGKKIVKICRGTACHVKGSRSILRTMQKELGLKEGETSPDYQFSLETVACLGACFLAPTMMVNLNYFGKLAPSRITSILDQYKKDLEDIKE